MRMLNPPHPGVFIKEEIIGPLGLTVTDAAGILGVDRQTLSKLLNTRTYLSPGMATRIEKAFGVRMDTLMRMQTSYDIAKARKMAGQIKVQHYEARV